MNYKPFHLTLAALICLSCAHAKQPKKKQSPPTAPMHTSQQVIQPRLWELNPSRNILATIHHHFAGKIYLKPVKRYSKLITLNTDSLNEKDAKAFKKWQLWAPKVVNNAKMRIWKIKKRSGNSKTIVEKSLRGKLLYTISNDAIIRISGKNTLVKAGNMAIEDREYISKWQWHGHSEPMKTTGKQADELRSLGLKPYIYKATIYGEKRSIPYQLFVPKKSRSKVPLVVFFHGMGERGNDNIKSLAVRDPLIFITPRNQKKYPCYFIAPQHPNGGKGWIGGINFPSRSSYMVKELVLELIHTHPDTCQHTAHIRFLRKLTTSKSPTTFANISLKLQHILTCCRMHNDNRLFVFWLRG